MINYMFDYKINYNICANSIGCLIWIAMGWILFSVFNSKREVFRGLGGYGYVVMGRIVSRTPLISGKIYKREKFTQEIFIFFCDHLFPGRDPKIFG